MAVTSHNVEYYVRSGRSFRKHEKSDAVAAVTCRTSMLRRVVFDGALRGHFSVLLDANEWQAIDAVGADEEGSDADASDNGAGYRVETSSSSSSTTSSAESAGENDQGAIAELFDGDSAIAQGKEQDRESKTFAMLIDSLRSGEFAQSGADRRGI